MGKSRIIGTCIKLFSLFWKKNKVPKINVIFSDPRLREKDEPLFKTLLVSGSLEDYVSFHSDLS